jgi:hypothetical protein
MGGFDKAVALVVPQGSWTKKVGYLSDFNSQVNKPDFAGLFFPKGMESIRAWYLPTQQPWDMDSCNQLRAM